MMKLKRLIIGGLLAFALLIAPIYNITLLASEIGNNDNDEIIDIIENEEEGNQTWLAKQLEIYGVPTAIATIISGLGVGGALTLFTKLFRKKNREIAFLLKELGMSEKTLKSVLVKLDLVAAKSEEFSLENETTIKNFITQEVKPIFEELKTVKEEINNHSKSLYNGALKVIKLLTTETEEDINSKEKM